MFAKFSFNSFQHNSRQVLSWNIAKSLLSFKQGTKSLTKFSAYFPLSLLQSTPEEKYRHAWPFSLKFDIKSWRLNLLNYDMRREIRWILMYFAGKYCFLALPLLTVMNLTVKCFHKQMWSPWHQYDDTGRKTLVSFHFNGERGFDLPRRHVSCVCETGDQSPFIRGGLGGTWSVLMSSSEGLYLSKVHALCVVSAISLIRWHME